MHAADADDYIGKLIATKYRVEALIGEGGMGKVYRAQQIALDKPVVLKVLRQTLLSDERTVARFQREAKAASRLNHPNSISILDFGQAEDGALYIAMEYVAGQDLHQILSHEWPLPEGRVIRIISQVLSALEDAHAAGVIHRDLKPENIMVEPRRGGETDFVKVLDFGIAKIQDNSEGPALTRAGFVCGTPEYMSPEQARGAPLDARSDLYAVGVILYQLTTGLLPFESDSAVGFATKHLTEEPPPPTKRRPEAKISPPMERLILRALSKNPDDRPQTAGAFKSDLHQVAKERRVSSTNRIRGNSSPGIHPAPGVLQKIPARVSGDNPRLASPWGNADTTVKQERSPAPDDVTGTMTDPPTVPVRAGRDQGSTRTVLAPPPSSTVEVPSMLPFKILTVVLVLIAVGLLGYYLYQVYYTAPQEPGYVPPANAPVQVGGAQGSLQGTVPGPLYELHLPREQWKEPKASRLVAEANDLYERGDPRFAVSKLLDAYESAPEPVIALKLGAIYRVLPNGDSAAQAWWRRYLADEPTSPARASILATYPQLAKNP